MHEDQEEFYFIKNEKNNVFDKELKDIQMSMVYDYVENDPNFILN